MKTKVFEIRDEGTCIPALAIKMQVVMGDDVQTLAAAQVRAYWIHSRCGYPRDGSAIVLMRLADQEAKVDPFEWAGKGRTMSVAHNFIYENFDSLDDGAVVDVRVLMRERAEPAESEFKPSAKG